MILDTTSNTTNFSKFKVLTVDDYHVFQKATNDIHGVMGEPMAVTKKISDGMHFCFLCDVHSAKDKDETMISLIYIDQQVTGEVALMEMKEFTL